MKSYPILVFLLSLFVDDALAAKKRGQKGLFVDHDDALLATKRGKAFLESLRQRVHVCTNNLPSNLAESSSHGISMV